MLPPRSLLFFVFVALSVGFDALVIVEFFKNHTHERILCWMAFLRLGMHDSTKMFSPCVINVVVIFKNVKLVALPSPPFTCC